MKIISTVHISYQISNEFISINTNKYVLTYTVRVTLLPMYLHIIICDHICLLFVLNKYNYSFWIYYFYLQKYFYTIIYIIIYYTYRT